MCVCVCVCVCVRKRVCVFVYTHVCMRMRVCASACVLMLLHADPSPLLPAAAWSAFCCSSFWCDAAFSSAAFSAVVADLTKKLPASAGTHLWATGAANAGAGVGAGAEAGRRGLLRSSLFTHLPNFIFANSPDPINNKYIFYDVGINPEGKKRYLPGEYLSHTAGAVTGYCTSALNSKSIRTSNFY